MNVRQFAKSGAALIAMGAAALLLAACSSDSGDGGASPAATPTPSGGGASSAAATPTPSGDASAPPTATPTAAAAPASADLEGRIAFRGNQDGSLRIFTVGGSGLERLGDDGHGTPHALAWSPDGSRIAFTRVVPEHTRVRSRDGLEVFVMNADGSGETRLTNSNTADYEMAWSPDGSRIAFISARHDHLGDLFVMNADGSGQTFIAGPARHPAWSPNGDRIAFTGLPSDFTPESYIHVVNADGSGETLLTETESDAEIQNFTPYWSPDGSRIAYVSNSGDQRRLFVMNADGSDKTQLADGAVTTPRLGGDDPAVPLAWSPDGGRIVYTAFIQSSHGAAITNTYNLYVVKADGSSPPTLLAEEAHSGVWSPDGSRIAFILGVGSPSDLYVMDADGSNQTRLTDMRHLDGAAWQPAPGG